MSGSLDSVYTHCIVMALQRHTDMGVSSFLLHSSPATPNLTSVVVSTPLPCLIVTLFGPPPCGGFNPKNADHTHSLLTHV